jgi:uncharacterized protein (TIGR03435 family)
MRITAALLVLLAGGCGAYAQQAGSPTFEVASIKPGPPPDVRGMFVHSSGGPGSNDPERYTAENLSLENLIMNAYDVKPYQLNAPDWTKNARFNVTAKIAPGATKDQFRVMLQNLLAERFGLKVHWEAKEMPVYELLVAKGGPRMKEAGPEKPADPDQPRPGPPAPLPITRDKNGFPVLPPGDRPMTMMVAGGKAVRRARRETMEQTASQISFQLGRPVVDATGLTGKYDFDLYWQDNAGSVAADGDSGPGLPQAIQEQLGLKLESKKGPVKILVLDHAEKTPVEN